MESTSKTWSRREQHKRFVAEVVAEAQVQQDQRRAAAIAAAIIHHRQRVIERGRRIAVLFYLFTAASFFSIYYTWGAGWVILSIIFAILGSYLSLGIRHWLRLRGVLGRDELPFNYLHPGLLFLRSFADDKWRYNIFPFGLLENYLFHLEEELFVDIGVNGPIVAIGGEQDSRSSIIRIALSESSWQDDVASLISRSETILLFPNFTGGLEWEIEYMLRPINRGKLLVLIPARGFTDIATRWSKFISQMMRCGIPPVPSGGWDEETLREQERLLPDEKPMVAKIRRLHSELAGDSASYALLRHCLLLRAVGCAFNRDGLPIFFTSTADSFIGRWWRPVPHTYNDVLRLMLIYRWSHHSRRGSLRLKRIRESRH